MIMWQKNRWSQLTQLREASQTASSMHEDSVILSIDDSSEDMESGERRAPVGELFRVRGVLSTMKQSIRIEFVDLE